jgi:uridine kinase
MNIAIMISGYLRGFTQTKEYIKKNIMTDENNKYDIYIHYSKIENDTKYDNNIVTIDEVLKELNPKCIISNPDVNFNCNKQINNLLNQNYKFYLLNKHKNNICKIENINYDVVIKIRPDVLLIEKLNIINIKNDIIYIPSDSKIDKKKLTKYDDKYICDIIAYGSQNIMNDYFNFYTHLDNLIKIHGTVNETLLYHYLLNMNIKYELIDIKFMVILSLCNTIAITGDSGSGKSTVSNILKELFNNTFVLECDRYHKWERGDENWRKYTHLNPDANYLTKMQQDVFDLKIGNSVFQIDYDHSSGKFTDKKLIESAENIIVCGLHSLYLTETIINIKIYIDTDDNLRIPWKIKRDVQKRGYSIEHIIDQIKSRDEDFKHYIYPQKNNADIIINLYTDRIFDISDFVIDRELNVYFMIGIRANYNLHNIIFKLNEKNITIQKKMLNHDGQYIYLYFEDICDYANVIKILVLNLM